MISRTERQLEGVKKWFKASGIGVLSYITGFGKTRCALEIIKRLHEKKKNLSVLVSVPTEVLKNQWIDQLRSWGFIDFVEVEIINTIVKHSCNVDLLVIDEIHATPTITMAQIYTRVNYQMILGLTATLERLDGKELLIKQYCPVCDEVTIEEAIENNWISQYKEYCVLLDVDLTEYQEMNKKFIGYFSYFDWKFDIAMKCATNYKFRQQYAKQMGFKLKDLTIISMDWMRMLQGRKKFVMSHPKKLEVANKIINARKDKKIITFSATIKDSELFDTPYVFHSKKSKKKNEETVKLFNKATSGVLASSKAADTGLDVHGLSVGIILSTDSSKIRHTQRVGRCIRAEEGKIAEMFTLVIKDTVEYKWFQNSLKSNNVQVIDESQLDKILAGKEVQTRNREILEDLTFRY